MVTFYINYLMLLFLSSIFIIGWHDITRGYQIIQPDNSRKFVGEIFGYWEIFFESIVSYKSIRYVGDAFENKKNELKHALPKLHDKIFSTCDVKTKSYLTDREYEDFKNVTNCEIDDDGFWYIKDPIHRFPSWIRKPLSACPTCMANPYGTAIYFTINYLQNFSLFNTFSHKILSIFVFWIFFIVILSRLNTILHNALRKY